MTGHDLSGGTNTPWRAVRPFLALAAAVSVILYRKPGAVSHPQFWAEDGAIFFADQWNMGANALLNPYADYLHLAPRLIALATDVFVPVRFAPHAYAITSLLVALAVLAGIFSPRVRLPCKPAFVLSVALIPMIQNEIFLVLTNIQWLLALHLVVLLVKTRPERPAGFAFDIVATLLCGLTGPFIMVMAPLFAGKFARERSAWSGGLFVMSMVAGAAQAWHVAFGALGHQTASHDIQAYASILGHKWFGTLFLGYEEAIQFNPWVIGLAGLAVVSALAWHSWRSGNAQPALFLAIGLAFLAVALVKFRHDPARITYPMNGIRYYFLPSIMIAWSLLAYWPTARRAGRILVFVLASLMLSASLRTHFRNELVTMQDYDWPGRSANIGTGYVEIPINPEGWKVKLNPAPE